MSNQFPDSQDPVRYWPLDPDVRWPVVNTGETRRRAAMASRPNWTDEGLLSISGYRVGVTNGVKEHRRRAMLNYIFLHDDLSDISNIEYALEWGEAGTDTRLQKLANCLATFARNASRKRQANCRRAIREWTADLAYLKETFYDRWAEFPWPDAEIPEGW